MDITIRDFDSLERAKETWLAFQHRGELYIFQTYEWLENWYTNVGARSSIAPCLMAVYSGTGEPLCFLPFAIQRKARCSLLTWLGEDFIDYGAPILAPALFGEAEGRTGTDFGAIWEAVLRRIPPVDAVWLTKVPETVNGRPNPICALRCGRYHSNAHYVRLAGGWEDFYNSHAGARTRSTDRRKHRRLTETGRLDFSMTDGSEKSVFQEITSVMIEQKQNRYREILAPDFLDSEQHRKFFIHPSDGLLSSGILHISGLHLNGEIITTHWGMTYRGRFYYYMPSFASGRWLKYSPGRLLLFHLFRWCFRHGVEVFDFTIGDEKYKRDWCDSVLHLHQLFSARTWKGGLYALRYRLHLVLLGNRIFLNAARAVRRFLYRIRYRSC